MNLFATFFFLLMAGALLFLPRRRAFLPLLAGACYVTLGQGIELGPLHLPVIRMLLAIGALRVLIKNERPAGGLNNLDKLVLAWGFWAVTASLFHKDVLATLIRHGGMVYNAWGIYFLVRCFCISPEDIVAIIKMTAWVLVPVALEMFLENTSGQNLFGVLSGGETEVVVRNERIRAQGPFLHPILAGTVGGVCLPLMLGIWRFSARAAIGGCVACFSIIVFSASSGPLLAVLIGVMAVCAWKYRIHTKAFQRAVILGYLFLEVVMKAPPYFLLARVDLTGSSTGWHRAELIRSSIEHLQEWWLAGTDYTRHWMVTGTYWSEDHADITSQFIGYGVNGGLPLMFLFIGMLWTAFRYVGQFVRRFDTEPSGRLGWCLGAALLAHVVSCLSVFYADQSFLFLFSNLAMIGSAQLFHASATQPATVSSVWDEMDSVTQSAG